MRKSFKYRLFTNKTQESRLDALFDSTRYLYNCALEHRIVSWNQWRKSVSFYSQASTLKEIRAFDPGIANLNFTASQQILRRLDIAFKAFFERIKKGETPGFPRFKGKHRFTSIPYRFGDGCTLKKSGKLHVQNVGAIRMKRHRPIEGKIKTAVIKRRLNRFYVCFSCDDVPEKPLPVSTKEIGLDMGIKTLIATSNGEIIDNPKHLKQNEIKLKSLQQKHSKKRRTKTRRALAGLHNKIRNQRRDFLHKLSRKIIRRFGLIFIEDLAPKEMLGDRKTLNKYINDAAWATFFDMLSYKAEEAGRKVIKVDPKGTTQTCSGCGNIVFKTLDDRLHVCSCGLQIDRDINAAINILRAGQALCYAQEAALL